MPTRAPLLTRGQLVTVIVAVLAVAASVVALVVTVPPAVRASQPDVPVRAYLSAIIAGDVREALELGRVTKTKADSLLTDAAYDQSSGRITAFSVLDATVASSGRSAAVGVRITQGDDRYDAQFEVERTGANPFAAWRLAKQHLPEVAFHLAAPLDRALSIAGVAFTATHGVVTTHVLPGTYAAQDRGDNTYFWAQDAEATATLGATSAGAAVMQLELSPDGGYAAESQVTGWIDRCAASADLAPDGCPFKAVPQASVTYSAGKWTIESPPRVDEGEWNAALGGWPVVTSSPGYVRYTARAAQGGLTGTATTGSNPFSVAGTITPQSGGGVRFVPSPTYSGTDTSGALT
ncbi:hypothetical protein GCM10022286_16250 [Gryllotalpicola daejeonensis]|uniref:Uncharacterized protein n=1 Tax=Gryllotalpicola daejeonensis TaxID=993087 RepID=A0ABP7ZJM9_9MICO